MRVKLERTDERLTRRTGLILVNRFGDRINLASKINRAFREPGSNRGFDASDYVLTLTEMMIDGATYLEDVRLFENDEAYKEIAEVRHYPTSDAIGDWLRRHGGSDGEQRLWTVISSLIQTMSGGSGLTLDIDGTLIEADKGDAQMTYKDFRGYHPLVGGSVELGLFAGSRFQHGNAVPQQELVSFIHECVTNLPGTFSTIRSDSAAYNHFVINDCFANGRRFTITADHDVAVMAAVARILKTAWKQGKNDDGTPAPYEVADTVHTMDQCTDAFRLVVKRTRRRQQTDLFDGDYQYWIIATNIPEEEKDAQAIIHFHNGRGEFEKMIGELKHHYGLDHLPCGQFSANSLYFTIGVLAFTLVQLLKRHYFGQEWKKKSIRSLRYYWLHLPSRIVSHARYTIAKVAIIPALFEQLLRIYLALSLAPPPA
ncbi:MAG: IS1380 family transposase [Candidatus Eisenbacteria bacterium]|nr:IS1380 family transposase [Candidatus Eisenbacteria bacterium]